MAMVTTLLLMPILAFSPMVFLRSVTMLSVVESIRVMASLMVRNCRSVCWILVRDSLILAVFLLDSSVMRLRLFSRDVLVSLRPANWDSMATTLAMLVASFFRDTARFSFVVASSASRVSISAINSFLVCACNISAQPRYRPAINTILLIGRWGFMIFKKSILQAAILQPANILSK